MFYALVLHVTKTQCLRFAHVYNDVNKRRLPTKISFTLTTHEMKYYARYRISPDDSRDFILSLICKPEA